MENGSDEQMKAQNCEGTSTTGHVTNSKNVTVNGFFILKSDPAVRQLMITCLHTGSPLGPKVQVQVQVLHHVTQLVVV